VINGPHPDLARTASRDSWVYEGGACERDNFYVACGFTSGHRRVRRGGRGDGGNGSSRASPALDLWAFDVRRFGSITWSAKYLAESQRRQLLRYYQIHYPIEELFIRTRRQAARALSLAGREERRVRLRRFGWERPNWFAPAGTDAVDKPTFEGRPNWFSVRSATNVAPRASAPC